MLVILLQYSKMEKKKLPSESMFSDSSEQFLQPISKFSPPNELITKNYSPDEKAVLKLVKNQKPEVLTCESLKNSYTTMFDEEDTLGYHYSYSLSHNIVYLKMNNSNYLKYKTKSGVYRFLAGFFIPPEKLISQQIKSSLKNIYRNFPDVQFTQYKTSIQESFGANSKSTELDLRFSSNFQSGNLFIAMKKRKFEYELILQNDINSKGNTQWFNFVVDFRLEGTYKFSILNFTKSYSQFQKGMKILVNHFNKTQDKNQGWMRTGDKIKYSQSRIRRQDCHGKNYYALTFQYKCNSPEKAQFAYFYPYSSLDLEKFMKKIVYRKLNVHMKMEKIKICETLSGLPIYVIHIHHKRPKNQQTMTNIQPNSVNRSNYFPLNNKQNTNKSVIFMARQHSGQTQGSFVIEGIIDMLMENGQIDYLKKNFNFYIFPMINIDGVFYGNYRTNLTGTDLNRIWRNPRKDVHPQIFHIKKYLLSVNIMSPISLILDVHGHSKSFNSFFYGNTPKKDIMTGQTEDTRLFPYVCSKKIKQISFLQSTFNISQDKKNSARIVLSEFFPRALVYTLENSFQGWKKQNGSIHEYTPDVLRKIGRELIITYLQFQKITQKNPSVKDKWAKDLQEIKQKQLVEKEDNGESDSEAQFQLTNIYQHLPQPTQEDQSIFKHSDTSATSMFRNRTYYTQKQKIIQRKLQINSQLSNKKTKYIHKIPSLQSSLGKPVHSVQQISSKTGITNPQGFLSIVKIKTTQRMQPADSPKFKNQQGLLLKMCPTGKNQITGNKSEKNIPYKFSRQNKQNIIEKLSKKNIRIEQAVTSSSGMKNFLMTMGIPLDSKYF